MAIVDKWNVWLDLGQDNVFHSLTCSIFPSWSVQSRRVRGGKTSSNEILKDEQEFDKQKSKDDISDRELLLSGSSIHLSKPVHKSIPEISFVWKEHCIFILNISGSNNGRKVTVWIIALFIISGCNKALSLSLTITEYGLRKYIGLSVYFIAGREAMLTFSSARKGRKRFCDLSWSLEQMGRMNLK